jgi:hypothetical protein
MTQAPTPAAAEGGTLSRGLSEFLVELSIAMQKTAIYPAGHPLLDNAVGGVVRRLAGLLSERATLSLGVARRQLVIEGVATDPHHPLLGELARRLHRHHLGAVRFTTGVTPAEVAEVLLVVSSSPEGAHGGTPLGLGPPEALARWEHVRLFALTYEQLQLLEGEDDETQQSAGGSRGAQLWIGLARAAMMAESAAVADDRVHDPVAVAKAIDQHQSDEAYDQVIVGYLLQIAQELNAAGGAESPALQARVSRMVASLDPRTLNRLLEMGGNGAQRKRFIVDAARGMKLDAVIDLVSAAAATSNQTISHSLLRLFKKLATHAEQEAGPMGGRAEAALRENITRLLDGWDLDDPNPDQYTVALEEMASAKPDPGSTDDGGELEADRIVKMSLETGAVGELVWEAVAVMCADGRIVELLDLIENAPDAGAAAAISDRTATQDNLRATLGQPRADQRVVARLAHPLGLAAAEPLLDALDAVAGSEHINEREASALGDLLVALGQDVGELVAARLPVSSWAMQRRLLAILGRLTALPDGVVPSELIMHPDGHVRMEALRLMLARETHRERALRVALADSDVGMLRFGLGAALEGCPAGLVPVILRRLADPDLGRDVRTLAIRVLAASRARAAMEYLMNLSVRKRRFWRQRIAPKTPEVLAALAGLAAHWSGDPRIKGLLALGARDGDPEIRAAVATERKR